ncbi:DNA repair protein RecO [Thermodesulfatator atlanticus]|uniref:DNA repair protein RecO n=1 Tax=Thermodesulfatator atlanticus TaxID=501497 RepID=UPI0003B5ADBA|nr:DNA repair protein RecO [Thermodesulfatator atlanticus]
MNFIATALVLNAQTVAEKDVFLSFLTAEKGRLAAIAKGARKSRKRFVNTLEPFTLIKAHLRGGKRHLAPFLDQADLIEPFEPLRLDYGAFFQASYLGELLETFFKPGAGKNFFPFACEAISCLAEKKAPWSLLKLNFELALLRESGFSPHLGTHCLQCGKILQEEVYFSFEEGGVLCRACAHENDYLLWPSTLAFLRHISKLKPSRLKCLRPYAENINQAGKLIERFLLRVADCEIHSLRILKDMYNETSERDPFISSRNE